MKVLVFLLVLGNLLFYAFSAGYLGHPDNPDAARVDQQITPERLRVVSRGEAPATAVMPSTAVKPVPLPVPEEKRDAAPAREEEPAAKPEPEKPAVVEKGDSAPVCLAWSQLSVAEADRVGALMSKRFADFKLSRKVVPGESSGWWVYIPALPGKAEAEKKAGELRNLGVTDFFIVQEGTSRHAISLGIFSREKGSSERLAELKAKGVRSAVIGPRPGKDAFVALQARGPGDRKAALIAAVADALQKNDVLACK